MEGWDLCEMNEIPGASTDVLKAGWLSGFRVRGNQGRRAPAFEQWNLPNVKT